MKTYTLKLNFLWDEEIDTEVFKLTVPDNITEKDIYITLQTEHNYLDKKDEEDLYGYLGRNPETLLDYICEKFDWDWEPFEFDMDIEFD